MEADENKQEDLERFETNSKSKAIAIGTVFAALYAVLVFLPISTFLGAGTSLLSAAIFVAPLFGILLGPRYGGAFGLIAGILATLIASQIGGIYVLLPPVILGPAISGVLTGLSLDHFTSIRDFSIPGPLITGLYLLIVIILYLIPNSDGWWFILPYVLAMIVAFILQFFMIDIQSDNKRVAALSILSLALIGTMTDFSMMTLGSVYIFGLDGLFFGTVVFPVMLIERTAAVIISSLIASILLINFKDEFPIK